MNDWYTIDLRFLPRPTDWNEMFGRTAPVILEIGFGRAGHLIHLGQTNPDKNVIGIETSRPSLRKASSKVKNNHLTNVRVIDGSGPSLLWMHIEPNSLDEVHVNFPDPWYKEGHQRRQLINDGFLELVASRLKEDGLLYIATDHAAYQPVVTECLERTPYFTSRLEGTYTLVDNERFRTKYELKALAEGRVPFYYKWKRNNTPTKNAYPIPEEIPMPHAILETENPLSIIADAFDTFSVAAADDSVVVRFIELYQSKKAPYYLIETYVNQKPQPQRIGLRVGTHSEGKIIIQLHDIGFPRANDGIHFAVDSLAQWILSVDSTAKIVRHNLLIKEAKTEPEEVE